MKERAAQLIKMKENAAQQTVSQFLKGEPTLSQFADGLVKSCVIDCLKGDKLTVFAPDNKAYSKLNDKDRLMLQDNSNLRDVLRNHIRWGCVCLRVHLLARGHS